MELFVLAQQPDPDVAAVFGAILIIFGIFVALIVVAIKILIFCKIFSKAGFCWALGLLMLLPIVNIIMAFVLAFADWPIQKELRLLKQQQ
ncbi:MAG: hypothetical protein ACYTFW_12125 [Planctomycetota bacterium]|jgi:hypothetical protein